jgi:hypothetical protein
MCYSEMEKKRRKKKQKKRRNGDQLSTELLMAEFKAAKEALRKEIRKSKAVTWESLLEEVDKDPWGRAYRIVTRKMGARTPLCKKSATRWQSCFRPRLERRQTDATRRDEYTVYVRRAESSGGKTKGRKGSWPGWRAGRADKAGRNDSP